MGLRVTIGFGTGVIIGWIVGLWLGGVGFWLFVFLVMGILAGGFWGLQFQNRQRKGE